MLPDGSTPQSSQQYIDYNEVSNTYLWEEYDPVSGANWRYFADNFPENGLNTFMPVFIERTDDSCVISLWEQNSANTNLRGTCQFEYSVELVTANAELYLEGLDFDFELTIVGYSDED